MTKLRAQGCFSASASIASTISSSAKMGRVEVRSSHQYPAKALRQRLTRDDNRLAFGRLLFKQTVVLRRRLRIDARSKRSLDRCCLEKTRVWRGNGRH